MGGVAGSQPLAGLDPPPLGEWGGVRLKKDPDHHPLRLPHSEAGGPRPKRPVLPRAASLVPWPMLARFRKSWAAPFFGHPSGLINGRAKENLQAGDHQVCGSLNPTRGEERTQSCVEAG